MTRSITPPAPELLYVLAGDPAELARATESLRSADIAEALNALPVAAAAVVLPALPLDLAVRVLDEPELLNRGRILEQLDGACAGVLLESVAPDQRAKLFRELPEPDRVRLFETLEPATRASLEQLLAYPTHSAGGIMTTELIALPTTMTVEEALTRVRRAGSPREAVHPIFVVRPEDRRLVHTLSLWDLLGADRTSPLAAVGNRRPPIIVRPLAGRDEVARLVAKYNLAAVPVVDAGGRLLGVVTVDDVIDAIVREQTEDVHKLGGMEALDAPYLRAGIPAMVRKRAGWLCALFLSEMLTATAMGHFEGEIRRAVVLALFVPLIISSGGNSGSQATSLIIRALALRQLRLRDWWRVIVREAPAGLILGVILGAIGFARIALWQLFGLYDYGPHHWLVAATVATALVGVVTFGSLAGSMLPFALQRLGLDPASASAPFVATLVDVTGLIIYFTTAFVILHGVLL